MAAEVSLDTGCGSQEMHRFVVNWTVANIFNGVFEPWKSGKKQEKFAEKRMKNASRLGVYHAGIKHAGRLYGANLLLNFGTRTGEMVGLPSPRHVIALPAMTSERWPGADHPAGKDRVFCWRSC
jgi:hypothetical protein